MKKGGLTLKQEKTNVQCLIDFFYYFINLTCLQAGFGKHPAAMQQTQAHRYKRTTVCSENIKG